MATTVDAKLLKSTKFPPEFNQKVDMQKVNLEVMKKWIAGKISDILGNEDDVVIELCFNLIEGSRYPDIKKLQIQLTGFLEKDTPTFCQELWKLCLSAQTNAQGVPKELLEAKKLELIQEKIAAEKAVDDARHRREAEQRRDREMDAIRNRERSDRARGGGRGDWRGGRSGRIDRGDHEDRGDRGDRGGRDFNGGRGSRGDREFDRRGPRYSRSPPRRRDSRERSFRDPHPLREIDSYVPRGRGDRGNKRRPDRRYRSPSVSMSLSRSRSRSGSPPRRRRRALSRSVSPHPRRRRSISRSESPDRDRRSQRGRGGRGNGRGRSPTRGHRLRSYTPSDDGSRSSSPKPRKRRRSPSASVSPQKLRRRRITSSASRSRSLSSRDIGDQTSAMRRGKYDTLPVADSMDIAKAKNTARRGHNRDERQLTRSDSGERSLTPPRKRRRSQSRSRSKSSGGRNQKRRSSIQRYDPARRRKRNTSSASSHSDRNKRADSSEDDRRSPRRPTRSRSLIVDRDLTQPTDTPENQVFKTPPESASELREKLLREKIMKMRTSSSS